jgi:hypothetical protein
VEPEIASTIVIAIATVLFIVWATAARFMRLASRERQSLTSDAAADFATQVSPGTITGKAEVPGSPDALAAKLAERLARDGLGFLGPVKITGADRREISFEAIGSTTGANASTPGGLRRGVVRFAASGNKTRIEYHVEAGTSRVLLTLGWLFLALGLAAIVIGLCLEFTFVIPSQQPGIRAQAFQMMQAVHFVWPPFLFAALSRQPLKFIRNHFEALINNLPYA